MHSLSDLAILFRGYQYCKKGGLDGLLDHNWAWYFHHQLHRIVFNPFNFVDLKDIEIGCRIAGSRPVQEQKETGTEHDNDTEAPHAKVSPGEEKKIMLDLWPSGYWHMDYLLNVLLHWYVHDLLAKW